MGRFALAVWVSLALASGLYAQNFNGTGPDGSGQAPDPNQNASNTFNQDKKALIAHGNERFKSMREEEEKKYSDAVKACNAAPAAEKAGCKAAAAKEKQKFLRQLNKAKASFKKFTASKTLVLNGKTTEEAWNGFNEKQINDTDGAWGPYADGGPIGSDNGADPVAQWWTETESFQKQRKDAVKEGKLEFKTLRSEQNSIFGDRLQACSSLPAGERAACRKGVQEDKKEFNADFAKAQKDYLAWVKGKEVVLRGKTEQQVFTEWAANYKERTGWSPAAMPAALAAGDKVNGAITPMASVTEVDGGHAVDPNAVAKAEQEAAEKANAEGLFGEGQGKKVNPYKDGVPCTDEERKKNPGKCRVEDRRDRQKDKNEERAACAKLTDLAARSACFEATYNDAGSEVGGKNCSDAEKRSGFHKCRVDDLIEHRKENRAERREERAENKEARAGCAAIADKDARAACMKAYHEDNKAFRKEERAENKEWRQERKEDRKVFEDKMKAQREAKQGGRAGSGTGATAP